jgi:hypothetical protein
MPFFQGCHHAEWSTLEKGGIPIEGNYHCSREISL